MRLLASVLVVLASLTFVHIVRRRIVRLVHCIGGGRRFDLVLQKDFENSLAEMLIIRQKS